MANFVFVQLPSKEEYQASIKNAKDDAARAAIRKTYADMKAAFNEEFPDGYQATVNLNSVELKSDKHDTTFLKLRGLKGAFAQLLPGGQISDSTASVERMLNATVPQAKALAFGCGGLGTIRLTIKMVIENESYKSKKGTEKYEKPSFRIVANEFTPNSAYGQMIANAAMQSLAEGFSASSSSQKVVNKTADDIETD